MRAQTYSALNALSWWNVYFILKFLLGLNQLIDFEPLYNLLLLCLLLLPVKYRLLHYLRQALAIPAGVILAYHESYLPGLSAFTANAAGVGDFDLGFVADFLLSALNFTYVGIVALVLLLFLLLQDYLRFTFLSCAAVLYLTLQPWLSSWPGADEALPAPGNTTLTASAAGASAAADPGALQQQGPASPAAAAAWLPAFYQYESTRRAALPAALNASDTPFDIVLLNICSLASSDLQEVGLEHHPLFSGNALTFTDFNSATSYSGPATLRLLRSVCGQVPHSELYSVNSECELPQALEHLGYQSRLFMDHSGNFGNYLQGLRDYAAFNAPLSAQDGYSVRYRSFDGEPIYSTADVFDAYLKEIREHGAKANFTLFNLVALHDGNVKPDGSFERLSYNEQYQLRAQLLLDDILQFTRALEHSGRQVLLIFIPEHGAALRGDKIQMSRLRDIPSPSITRVPVFVKFINSPHRSESSEVAQSTSYQALAALIGSALSINYFAPDSHALPDQMISTLPMTYAVSENDGSVVVRFNGTDFLQLRGRDFTLYPR